MGRSNFYCRHKEKIVKKILILFSCICIVTLVILSIKTNPNTSNTSNTEEYYYNKDGHYKDDSSMEPHTTSSTDDTDKTNPTPTGLHKESVPIDTDPTSYTVLVNKVYSLPQTYIPEDLVIPNVAFDFNYYDEKKLLREVAATALEKLFAGAEKDNIILTGVSGYRSYRRQESIYNKNIRTKGEEYTNKYSARPGYSEHQTGLSIDVSCKSMHYDLEDDFAETDEGKWLAKHCAEYGFIIRFPLGKEYITGYSYEPWHIRYVGVKLATYLTKNSMTLEEYYDFKPDTYYEPIDSHDNDMDVDDKETYTPKPRPTTRPTKRPLTTAKPKPSPTISTTPEINSEEEPTLRPTKTPKPTRTPKPTKAPNQTSTSDPVPEKTPEDTLSPTTHPVASEEPDVKEPSDDSELE